MFNEGYSASSGEALVQPEFCVEAVRLSRALAAHPVTAAGERRACRPAGAHRGAPADAGRSRRRGATAGRPAARAMGPQPDRARPRPSRALGARARELTVWHLRAEIALAACDWRPASAETDWPRIVAIYDQLRRVDPSPVVELARAVAIGRAEGPAAGSRGAARSRTAIPTADAARGVFLVGSSAGTRLRRAERHSRRRGRWRAPSRSGSCWRARLDGPRAAREASPSPEPQQQVVDAVQLDVEVLELGVEILPLRQAALGAQRGVDFRHRSCGRRSAR